MYGFISARRLETALQRRVHVPAHTLYAASMSWVTPSGIDESSVLQRKPRVIAKLLAKSAHQTESVYSNSRITRSRGSGVVIICLTQCPTRFILGPGNRWLCYILSVPSSAPMSLINLGCFCASTSHGCLSRRARSIGMGIASSVATTPPGLSDTCGVVNTMRTRLGFSLTMSRDGFHSGGRGVRRTRNEGERDSSNARGDGWL